jgi:hypothetical protein
MTATTFSRLAIGDRFRSFQAAHVGVYVKTNNTYEVDQMSGYPHGNATSELHGTTGFKLTDPVLRLNDDEVPIAKEIEHSLRIGNAIGDNAMFNQSGSMYLKMQILRKSQPHHD